MGVVVNPTASDDFAFMNEDNPYDKPTAVGDDNEATFEAPKQENNEDPFASMVDNNNEQNNDLLNQDEVKQDEMGSIDEKKEPSENEPTFLSVWQEERKLELEKRINEEKEHQKKLLETAQGALEKFESDRAQRIENKKKENREKENDLREDLNAVFKHGTIWEQVGKMVNLNEKMGGLGSKMEKDRFRDLLIHLRNVKGKKQGK